MYVELSPMYRELSRFDLVVYSKFAVTIHVSFAEYQLTMNILSRERWMDLNDRSVPSDSSKVLAPEPEIKYSLAIALLHVNRGLCSRSMVHP
jgi:hypothetical protein